MRFSDPAETAGLYNRDMAVSYQARVVFPVDRPPIEHGVVTVEGTRIVEVGKERVSGEFHDLGSVALFPGLVNAHTHLEFSKLQRPLGTPGMSFVDWIQLVIAERGRASNFDQHLLARGLLDCRAAGVTTVGDIATQTDDLSNDIIDVTYFHEVIGFSLARAGSALSAAISRVDLGQRLLDFRVKHSIKVGLAECDARHGISPHAPYTVSPQLTYELVMLARQRKMPMAMHIAESREELELLQSGSGRFQELLEERSMWDPDAIPLDSRPLAYLKLLADAPRALVVHGNYLTADELAFIGNRFNRMSLIYCPRTHAYFGHEPYPLVQALAAGVRVALGTDSRASNPDLDLLAEMRFVARVYPAVSRQAILRMGTLAGAEALGRAEEVGSITIGKLANFVAAPIEDDVGDNADAVLERLLAGDGAVSGVWMRGNRLHGV